MNIDDLQQFSENIFSICTFFHRKFTSEEFQKSFFTLEEITKNYRILLRRITNVQSKLAFNNPDYNFLSDFQAIIIQPVQRTMRYTLTLKEIVKYSNILLSDEVANFYQPLKAKNSNEELSRQVIKTLIPNTIQMLETQLRYIDIEVYLLEAIDKINHKVAELLKSIEKGTNLFFKEKNILLYASVSCCNSTIKKMETAIKNKDYVFNHVLKDIVSESVNTIFSADSICKISAHSEYKNNLISFFNGLIRGGDKYYTNKEKVENKDIQKSMT